MNKILTTNIKNCARCGQNHDNIEFKEFTNTLMIQGYDFNYWAMCPMLEEPIVLRIIKEED